MGAPVITTIIPTFHRPHLLKRAIGSVLGQTFRNCQVCIYDNASGDETGDIVAEFARRDSRVKYHRHTENIGAGANFNYGLARVNSPYFSFLSDDDFLLPFFYEDAMESLAAHPEAAFFAGSVVCMTEEGRVLYEPLASWKRQGLFCPEEGFINTVGSSYPIWTGIVFRTSAARKASGLDLACGSAADLEFVSRIASRFPFVISKKSCAVCVSHPGSSSKLPRLRNIWPGWQRMMQSISKNVYLSPETKRDALKKLSIELSNTLVWLSFRATLSGRFFSSRRACVVLRKNGHFTKARLFAAVNNLGHSSPILLSMLRLIAVARRNLLGVFNLRRTILDLKFGWIKKHLHR
jgi:glycosyltransferase involved in cell wall biosynthesis